MTILKNFKDTITTEEELRTIIGEPKQMINDKVISFVDENCKKFISLSPFVLIGTANADGSCDVSPRGDCAGFVQVIDNKTLLIPERRGNKKIDSLRNILSNNQIGLLFIIPGLGETLRVNGKAVIVKDQVLLEKMEVNGVIPSLGIGVEVEELYIHCAKAMLRSKIWDHQSYPMKDALPSAAKILAGHLQLPKDAVDDLQSNLDEAYANRLY
ncbi:pyridoxamine 5'-phosphate oxidase family protein [Bacillus sp. SM2101]|uniref:pyridoxamine 5'-phosphate oxidase family protein n=1 Tax=Bacillus sp. SM2101 TaxID=2805366 RepID=UPI001BDDFB9E|nr:pyridoxamine 5'-phosphate oxidase family protein [Bacillus sp. SM2101]